MHFCMKSAVALLVSGVGLWVAAAQQPPQRSRMPSGVPVKPGRKIDRTLTQDERLSIIAAALDSKVRRNSGHDCSHLVHAIYERAGFPYAYSSSDDLYDGVVEGFRRVTQPQPGDIVVWPGHAGIVVRPSHHVFFSFLTAGPGIDDYHSNYWIGRGEPRFYRYVKGTPALVAPRSAESRQPGQTN
jgi:cell wall-associated NlpC family hydrolase